MRVSAAIGLLLGGLIMLPTPVAVASEPQAPTDAEVVIKPYLVDGDRITVTTDQAVTIQLVWAACTRGLARAFPHASVVEMTVVHDGVPYVSVGPPAREYWTQIGPIAMSTEACVMHTDTAWATEWSYELGTLAPGEYQVAFTWTLSHRYTDGADIDGDGTPDPNDLSPDPMDFTIDAVVPN